MRTVIVSDVHGDYLGLQSILRDAGAIDEHDNKLPGVKVIQLGDLAHGGSPRKLREGVNDDICVVFGLMWCDTILIGNHELPHLFPYADFPVFGGMGTMNQGTRTRLLDAHERGQVVAAASHERWLLTHAGLHAALADGFPKDAEAAARTLNSLFTRRCEDTRKASIFDNVGWSRGGRNAQGGIFWCDWRELRANGLHPEMPQIVGHTPQDDGYDLLGDSWCIDAGAALSERMSALVQDEAGAPWLPLTTS